MTDVIVIGGGPAGMLAALSTADLGARTVLVTRGAFGGMAANDGPIPVRTLSQAARLIRDARQLGQYGIAVSRQLPVPGFEFTSTHSDAWRLTAVPPSMLVIGGGDTGLQVASIFNAFGSRVEILEAAPRILLHADDDVAAAVAGAFRASGVQVRENFGAIESFEKTATG